VKVLAFACALCACGDDAMMSNPDARNGSGDGPMMTDDGGMPCMKPALDQPWLAPLLSGAVSGLAGAPRATNTQRQTARTFLMGQLTQIGWTPQLHNYNTGANVYATIPATNGVTKQIVVGAHFDTVSGSPGANDNATGTAGVLEAARILARVPHERTIVFACFSAEEQGLIGAWHYAKRLKETGVNVVAMQYLNVHCNLIARPTLFWCDVPRTVERLNFKPTILVLCQRNPFSDFA